MAPHPAFLDLRDELDQSDYVAERLASLRKLRGPIVDHVDGVTKYHAAVNDRESRRLYIEARALLLMADAQIEALETVL